MITPCSLPRRAWRVRALAASASLVAAFAVACIGGADEPAATPSPAAAAATASPAPTTDGTASPAPAGELTVASADGAATLMIPAGALPAGVDPDDIRIVPVPLEDFGTSENAVVLAAYELTPDGLQLARPAVLRLSLPDGPESGLILILHLSEDSVEFLQVRPPADGGTILNAVEVELSHFSNIVAASTREALLTALRQAFTATIAVEGGNTHVRGVPFDVTGTVATKPADGLTIEIGARRGATIRVTFRDELNLKQVWFTTKNEEKVQPIADPSSRYTGVDPASTVPGVHRDFAASNFVGTVVFSEIPAPNPFVWPFVCEEVSSGNEIRFEAARAVKVEWERFGTAGTVFRSGTDEIYLPGAVFDSQDLNLPPPWVADPRVIFAKTLVDCVASAPESPTEPPTEPTDGTAGAVGGDSGEEVPGDPESGDSAGDGDPPPQEEPPAGSADVTVSMTPPVSGQTSTVTVTGPANTQFLKVTCHQPTGGEEECTAFVLETDANGRFSGETEMLMGPGKWSEYVCMPAQLCIEEFPTIADLREFLESGDGCQNGACAATAETTEE